MTNKKQCDVVSWLMVVLTVLDLSLGTHLFVEVPRPEDSGVTFTVFESSCYLLLPV